MIWSDWHPFTKPELPGVPEPLLDHYIRLVAIDFFEESQTWVVETDVTDLVAGTGTYPLAPPASITTGADVAQIKWAWVNNQQILPASQEELGQLFQYWGDVTGGAVSNYTQLTQDTVTLYPIPDFDLTGGLRMKVALRPSLTSTGVPDWLGSKYITEIASGVKAEMMGMVGQPWSNPEGEAKYSALFASGLTKATVEGNRSFTRSTMNVQLKRF